MKGTTRILLLLGAAALVAAGAALLPGKPAVAGFTSESTKDLVAYVKGDAAWNLRLMALDALRKKTESGVEGELSDLATETDVRLAIAATTSLGKKQTTAAKAKLEEIIESEGMGTQVRKAAMTAIAVHFAGSGDLDYLASVSKDDAALAAHCAWLKTNVFGKK